jgi:hypothetical protein
MSVGLRCELGHLTTLGRIQSVPSPSHPDKTKVLGSSVISITIEEHDKMDGSGNQKIGCL